MSEERSSSDSPPSATANTSRATSDSPLSHPTSADNLFFSSNIIRNVFPAISVSLGSMIVGFVCSYSSPAIPSMKTDPDLAISTHDASWIGSLLPLCAIFGGMMGGPAIDMLGRRTTILLTGIPFFISFLLVVLAVNIYMIFAARCIAGLCTGIISLAMPVYLSETIHFKVRGILGLLPTIVGNLGILVCFISGKYLNWTQLAMVGGIIPIPFVICMFLIPETPRWYIRRDRKESALKALQWLRGKEADVSKEFNDIEKTYQQSRLEESSGIGELFSRRYIRPLLITVGLMFFQQFSGINAVMYYTVDIFEASKSSIDKNLCTIFIGLVNLGSVILSSVLIDRLGRKILLYASSLVMTVTIIPVGIYFFFQEYMPEIDIDHLRWLPLVNFIIYIIGFSIGFGPVPWLMMGEVLPVRIRGPGASITTSFNWFSTFVITKTILLIGSFSIPFIVYGICCFISLFFILFIVPETKGKSLEDIERNLQQRTQEPQ